MTLIPGPRTNPTVKSMANSNQRDLRSWQLNLGPIQSVILLGVVMGCLVCAFYLGFWSGQKYGIETALNNNLSNAMRLPIETESELDNSAAEGLSDVYAKLDTAPLLNKGSENHQAARGAAGEAQKAKDIPELGSIRPADEGTVQEALNAAQPADGAKAIQDSKKALADNQPSETLTKPVVIPGEQVNKDTAPSAVRVLGEPSANSGKTLGAIAAEEAAKERKTKNDISPITEKASGSNTTVVAKAMSGDTKGPADIQAPSKAQPAADEPAKSKEKAAEKPSSSPAKLNSESAEKTQKGSLGQETTLVTSTVPHGWFAQIVAPRSQSEAESMARHLKGSGFSVVIENATVRGEQYFRVLVGPEENRQQAERMIGQLKREPYIKADPFIRMVR
jgi:cell division septation protein DedD